MSFSRRFHSTLRKAALVSAGALATVDAGDPTVLAGFWFLVLAAACRLSYTRVELLERPWRPATVTTLVLTVTAAAAAEYRYLGVPVILVLGHYMIAVQAVRMMERKRGRDHAQVLVLSGLVMVIAAVVSASVVYAFFLAAFLWYGGNGLLMLQLKRDGDRRNRLLEAGGLDAGYIRATDPLTEVRHTGPIRRYGLVLVSVMLVMAVGVSLALPRGTGGFLGEWQARPTLKQTGFNETVDFSQGGKLEQDDTVVMHVRLTDAAGRLIPKGRMPAESLLFRGATQEAFDGAQWSSAQYGGGRRTLRRHESDLELTSIRNAAGGRVVRQEITLYNAGGNNLFALYPPARVESCPVDNVSLDRLDLTLRARAMLRGTQSYVVESVLPPAELGPDDQRSAAAEIDRIARSPTAVDHLRNSAVSSLPGPNYARGFGGFQWRSAIRPTMDRQGESGSERRTRNRDAEDQLSRLAAGILERAAGGQAVSAMSPRRKAQAIADFLQREFRYSLDAPPGINAGGRPMMDFLFSAKRGNCQFFASAMVMLCRTAAVDLPARLVTGFRGGEYNDDGGFLIVRNRDAHAWAEVHLAGVPDPRNSARDLFRAEGWCLFDPTPSAEAADEDWWVWRKGKALFELLDHHWGSTVLAFNKTRRDAIGASIVEWIAERGIRPAALMEAIGLQPDGRLSLSGLPSLPGIIGLVLVGGGIWLLFRKPRPASAVRKTPGAVGDTRRTPPRPPAFYNRLVELLGQAGIQKLPAATPMGFARAVAAGGGPQFSDLPRVMGFLYQVRYADRPLTPDQQAEIDRLGERIRTTIGERGA